MRRLINWLFGLRAYSFQYRGRNARHTVYARSIKGARRKMRAFLQEQIYGPWALTYDPAVVEHHLRRCRLVGDE